MKKRVLDFLVLFMALSYGFGQESQMYNVGQKSISYTDDSRDRPIVTEIWYPTKDIKHKDGPSQNQRMPFVEIKTIPNANIANDKFPLLLVSHGTGGNRFSLTWFIEEMVQAGYIVVSVDHYGNNSFHKLPREFVKWWERAIDIQYVLTEILKDDLVGESIDRSKIGGVGFSLGGYTNIALAGGYVDRSSKEVQGSELPPEFPDTGEEINFETDSLIVASYLKYKDKVKDDRIKAFFVMAPAIGFGFHSKAQVKDITAPIFMVAGKGDTNTPVKYNAEKYKQLISTSTLHLFGDHVDHYVFLNEGTDFGKQILPQLTVDHPTVDRKEIHEKTVGLAMSFFKETL